MFCVQMQDRFKAAGQQRAQVTEEALSVLSHTMSTVVVMCVSCQSIPEHTVRSLLVTGWLTRTHMHTHSASAADHLGSPIFPPGPQHDNDPDYDAQRLPVKLLVSLQPYTSLQRWVQLEKARVATRQAAEVAQQALEAEQEREAIDAEKEQYVCMCVCVFSIFLCPERFLLAVRCCGGCVHVSQQLW